MDKLCVGVPVAQAIRLNDGNFQPRAFTPLIEASYKTIKAVEKSIKGRKYKVVICIQTDGEENASGPEYTWEKLNALIKEKIALGWEFNFMGASLDAYDQGRKMGIGVGSTMSYDTFDPKAMTATFTDRGVQTRAYARGLAGSMAFSASIKQAVSYARWVSEVNARSICVSA